MEVRSAERKVRSLMREPDSAKFSRSTTKDVGGIHVACGFVNSRNGFGGYTGDTMWIVSDDLGIAVVNTPGQEQAFAKIWNKYCAG